ncbi:hypothetical protein VFPPC_15505 [Pochonia chlamydosporia 170]|uniref:Uncharacterized protein n=1 Tax=Pochonia chlamydosporia 170 TaxID=1380566 RepID=A0A179FW61_METCM|nr:hypothetical protein VFPPC_15505 [Pochonia chlamydosporia 170]OAQ69896.1 hypothetical protein VFPPC_15505 [Pochonia chlamydosporia 170]
MHSNIITVIIAALVSSSAALVIRNKHVGDFRLFSNQGCSAGNLGVWTIIDDDVKHGKCVSINDSVQSIYATDVNQGCKFYLYNDGACKVGKTNAAEGTCSNTSEGWKSWSMDC